MSKNLLDYVGLGHFLEKIKTLFVTGLGTSGNSLTWTKNGTTNNITIPYASKSSELIPLQTKLYTGVIGTANNNPGAVFYFMSIRPEDWNKPCKVTYRIYAEMDGLTAGKAFSIMSIVFSRNTTAAYDVWNYIGHTDYRPYYYHYRYLATATGYNNNYGHLMGIGLNSSYSPTTATYARNFTVDVLEATDCTVTLFDTMTKYANVPGTGSTNYSGETTYNATAQGETHSGDNNDVNYQNREYYGCRKTNSALYRYTLCLTKSDGSIVPLNSVSNTVATTKELTSDSFDPFGEIFYWNSTTTYSAGTNVGDGSWYRQILFDARYSFNTGGYNATGTLVARSPVYLVAVPRSDGTAVLNSTPLALVLPTEDDGLIYIYLGRVYPDSYPYRIALSLNHPVYYYKNGAVRLWSSEQDPIFSASPAAGITSTNITAWNGKQDAISDLATIRSGASAGATAYQKPSGGIPKTDLSSAVQTSLGKADTALQSHQDISGKVDKVTSTDNAVVRFDGTSGAIQNSGVTINDSNHVTAAKFITSGGTNSQFVKGDGSLSEDNKVPYSGVLMPTNPFGGKGVYINSMDNALSAADRKYYVTVTKHNKVVDGVTYPHIDNTKEATDDDYYVDSPVIQTFSMTAAHYLFDGSYETNITCGANEYIKIRIMFGSNTSPSASTSYFQGYPYGKFYLSYYYNQIPNAASQCRIYNKYANHGVGWHLYTATAFTGVLNAASFIERVSDESDANRTCVEFIVYGNSVSGRNVGITQIDYQLTRPFIGRDGSTVTKFDEQSLYYPFNWYNEHLKTVTINNNGNITAVKFIKSGGTSSQFLKADGSVDSTSYGTYSKPSGGIPASDLASAVLTSLGKADSALQSFTETDPTVPSWAKQSSKPTYTAQEVGALPASTSIPSKTSDLTNDSGFLTQHQDISGKENTSNKVTSLSSSSTDTLYPSAKCVYDLIKDNCVFVEGTDTYLDF